MTNPNYFVFLGSKDDYFSVCANPFDDQVVNWTTHPQIKEGDIIFFYFTSPISAISAQGVHLGYETANPVDPRLRFSGRLLCWASITRKDLNIPIRQLRELFPDWPWLRYPRQNTRIPDHIVEPFLEMAHTLSDA